MSKKNVFKYCFKKLMYIINVIFVFIFIFLFFLLYLILFETPIPYVSEYVVKKINQNNEEIFHSKDANIGIDSIALAWNFDIKKLVVIVKGVKYKDSDKSLSLNKVTIQPYLSTLVSKGKINIKRLYFHNLEINLEEKGKGYNLQFDNFKSSSNIDKIPENNNVDSSNNETLNQYNLDQGFYNLFVEKKNTIDIISTLSDVSLYDSIIKVKTRNETFLVNIKELKLLDNKGFDIKSEIELYKENSKKFIQISSGYSKLSAFINPEGDLDVKMNFNKLKIGDVKKIIQPYLKDISVYKKLDIYNLPLSGNIFYTYKTSSKSSIINADISTTSGSLTYISLLNQALFIENSKLKFKYDSASNIAKINDFAINFRKNSRIEDKDMGFNIPINQVSGSLEYNFNNQKLIANNSFNLIDNTTNILSSVTFFKDNLDVKITTNKDIDINIIKDIWPINLGSPVRLWVVDHIIEGNVDSSNLQLKASLKNNHFEVISLNGQVDFNKVNINYLDGMPNVYSDKVTLTYSEKDLELSYYNAVSNNVKSSSGKILFKPYQVNKEEKFGMFLNINLDSSVQDALKYIDNDPLEYIKHSGFAIESFDGIAKGKLDMLFSFSDEEVKSLGVDLDIAKFVYKKAFKDQDVSNGDIHLNVNLDGFTAKGKAEYLGAVTDVAIDQKWDQTKESKYNFILKNVMVENAAKLDIIPNIIMANLHDKIDVNVNYSILKNISNIYFQANLKNATVNLDYVDYYKEVGDNLMITGLVKLEDNNLQNIKNLKILGSGLDIISDLSFDNNKINVSLPRIKINRKVDIYGLVSVDDNNIKVDIKGNEFDISKLVEKNKKVSQEKTSDDSSNKDGNEVAKQKSAPVYNYDINLAINNIRNGKLKISNAKAMIIMQNNNFNVINLRANINSRNNSSIVYDDITKLLGLKIYNFGYLLKFLNLSKEISGGNLEGNIALYNEKVGNENIFKSNGQIFLHDFSAGLSFSSATVAFQGRDNYFDILELSLSGNIIGGNLEGYFDGDNKYLLLSGSLVPIWGANNLISNSPFVGKFLKTILGKKQDGLIDFGYTIKGNLDNLKSSYFTRKNVDKSSLPTDNQLKANASDEDNIGSNLELEEAHSNESYNNNDLSNNNDNILSSESVEGENNINLDESKFNNSSNDNDNLNVDSNDISQEDINNISQKIEDEYNNSIDKYIIKDQDVQSKNEGEKDSNIATKTNNDNIAKEETENINQNVIPDQDNSNNSNLEINK